MPSPFPGMDPYVEKRSLFPNIHLSLIAELRNELNATLPDAYVADIGERVYIQDSRDDIVPDVFISTSKHDMGFPNSAGGATAVCDEPLQLVAFVEETTEPFIRIIHSKNNSRVITEIEILSPSNKSISNIGREEYLKKQKRLLVSHVHFIEIDLLRAGKYTVSCPRPTFNEAGNWDYIVSLHLSGKRGEFEAWARSVRQPLPRIRVPLDRERGDPDMSIDLQAIFSRCYDNGRFHLKANYDQQPDPPLNSEDTEWAAELLKNAVR